MKSILRFLAILAVGVGIYFYQNGLPADLPFISQTGQVIETEVKDQIISQPEIKTEAQPEPLKVESKFIADKKESADLSILGVIKFTNEARGVESLVSLTMNEQLNASAKLKVEDMFRQQYFAHDSPDGTTMNDLITKAGYEYITIGENLALGDFKDDEALVTAWMNSPGHRANILNANYTEIGVAVGYGLINGSETWLAVQHFGRPKNLCPDIDGALKESIETRRVQINALADDLGLDAGGAVTVIDYITDFNKISEYNSLVEIVAKEIELYNQQVSAYNICISLK